MLLTVIFGVVLLLSGAFLVFSQLYDPRLLQAIIRFWPLLLSAIGIIRLRDKKSNKYLNLTFVALGLLLTYVSISFRSYFINIPVLAWGCVLAALGLFLLFQRKSDKGVTNSTDDQYKFEFDSDPDELDARWEEITRDANWDFNSDAEPQSESKEEIIEQEVKSEKQEKPIEEDFTRGKNNYNKREKQDRKFGRYEENIRYTNVNEDKLKGFKFTDENVMRNEYFFTVQKKIYDSSQFSGGRTTAVFSEVWLDLSKVKPKADVITLNASVIFSTMRIRVPDNWSIYMSGNTIFGDTSIPNRPPEKPEYKLYISNNVTFGSLKVEYK